MKSRAGIPTTTGIPATTGKNTNNTRDVRISRTPSSAERP
jgi:hypothetical protein